MSNFDKNKTFEEEDEVCKHRKNTKSNKSKSKKKADHKHNYKKCLLKFPMQNMYSGRNEWLICVAGYCTICGKLNIGCIHETERDENGYNRMLTSDEILEKYKDDLPLFEIETDLYNTQYIPITKE